MKDISLRPIHRRNFIKVGLAAAGSVFALGTGKSIGSNKQTTRWAFMADSHIPADADDTYRGFYPYQNLKKIVPNIASTPLEGVTIAGDLARLRGELGDYANLKELLTPLAKKTPIFMALGNHDNRNNFVKVFVDNPGENQPVKGKHVVVAKKAHVRLIMLDSLLYVNKVPGLLGKAQRQWLEAYLKKSDDTPSILCFHHTLGDGDGVLLDVPRLFDMIAPIRKVKALVFGHSHAYRFSQFEGIHLINLPAVGYNFNDAQPVGWVEAHLNKQGGDFVLHAAEGNKSMNGHTTKLTWR